jgi:peptidoglycan/LPS O-acetylase OafA/YrhL
MEVVSIQYLRGCAALMIVLFHLELQLIRSICRTQSFSRLSANCGEGFLPTSFPVRCLSLAARLSRRRLLRGA